jgi:Peptidase family M41
MTDVGAGAIFRLVGSDQVFATPNAAYCKCGTANGGYCHHSHSSKPIPDGRCGTTADRVEASEVTEREIDIAVRDIVARTFDRATEILRARRADLDEGARLLLAQETVTADQFPAIRSAGPQTKSAA